MQSQDLLGRLNKKIQTKEKKKKKIWNATQREMIQRLNSLTC